MADTLGPKGMSERDLGHLPKTHWGKVLDAGNEDSPSHASALESLCELYWPPVYAYLRRKNFPAEEARDLTQGFFAFLLEHHTIARADPNRGRFRNFLIACLENFLSTLRRRENAMTRGVPRPLVAWDNTTAEQLYREVLVQVDTPERTFGKRWAVDLLDRARQRLRTDYELLHKGTLVDKLEDRLLQDSDATPYELLSAELGVSAAALRVIVHRMRQRFKELIRSEIAATGVPTSEIDDEICHLMDLLGC